MSESTPLFETRHIRTIAGLILILCVIFACRFYCGLICDPQPQTTQAFALKLNPNTATWQELASLPQIGPVMAKRIVDFRNSSVRQGNPCPFHTIKDLDQVPGIGERTLLEIGPYLAFP